MKKKFAKMFLFCSVLLTGMCITACEGELDVRQEYPFTVEAMPVADKITNGETVEIRLDIKEEGNFTGTVYTLRYFQPDGAGILKMADGTVLKPNDRYLISEKKFRLYYTSKSADEAQTIDLYFENNWGSLTQLSFDFNNKDKEEETPEDGAVTGKGVQS